LTCESVSFSTAFASRRILSQTTKSAVVVVRQDHSLVRDFVIFLARKWDSGATQLDNESVLVDDFVVALSQLAINLHAKTHQLKNFFFVE